MARGDKIHATYVRKELTKASSKFVEEGRINPYEGTFGTFYVKTALIGPATKIRVTVEILD